MTIVPIPTENQKSKMKTQKRHQNIRLHSDCGPTYESIYSHPTGVAFRFYRVRRLLRLQMVHLTCSK